MPAPVRVAIFGNSFAQTIQLPALRHAGRNEVIGIAGRDAEKAARTAREWGIPSSTSAWRDLLELGPDLVLISTPVDTHFEMVRAALQAGAAVLCEKPFTLNVAEAQELAQLAQGKLALIDHQLRWSPLRRRVCQLLEEGFVGRVFQVRSDLVIDHPAFLTRPHSWWFEASRGGGVLGALASHLIDSLLWMFGEIEAVSARLETFVPERSDAQGVVRKVTADDHAELWLEMSSGASVSLTSSVVLPGAARMLLEVGGSEGSLRLEMETELLGGKHGDPLSPLAPDLRLAPPESYSMRGGGAFAACEPLFLGDVLGAVASGAKHLPGAANFADGLACMRVLDAARQSSREHGARVACR